MTACPSPGPTYVPLLRAGYVSTMSASLLGGVTVWSICGFFQSPGESEKQVREWCMKTKGSGKSDQPAGSSRLERSVLVITASWKCRRLPGKVWKVEASWENKDNDMYFEAGSWYPASLFSQGSYRVRMGYPLPHGGVTWFFLFPWLLSQGFSPPTHKQHCSGLRGLARLAWERSWAVPWTQLFPREWSEGQPTGGNKDFSIILIEGPFAANKDLLAWDTESRRCSYSSPAFLWTSHALESYSPRKICLSF